MAKRSTGWMERKLVEAFQSGSPVKESLVGLLKGHLVGEEGLTDLFKELLLKRPGAGPSAASRNAGSLARYALETARQGTLDCIVR